MDVTASGNEEYSLQRDTGDDADSVIDGVGQNSNQDFTAIGVAELLRLDPRPTFVVHADSDEGLEPVFLNEALRADDHLIRARSTQGRGQHATKSIQRVYLAWIKDRLSWMVPHLHLSHTAVFCGLDFWYGSDRLW